MITTVPKAVKLWGRGQLTIPKAMRQVLHLEADEQFSVFVIGRCLLLTPKKLLGPSLARDAARSMRVKKLRLDQLLRELKQERRRYNQERHAR